MTHPVPTEGREGRKLPDCMMPDGAEPCIAFQRLKAERDELLAALKSTTGTLAYVHGEEWETVKRARAAIALAEGR